MIDELCELLRRETEAARTLEGRLRALELVVAADEHRFVALALDEMETASEHLAALELTRVLALATAGLPADVAASDLVDGAADPTEAERMRAVVAKLAAVTERLGDARDRAKLVVATRARTARDRLSAANAFALH